MEIFAEHSLVPEFFDSMRDTSVKYRNDAKAVTVEIYNTLLMEKNLLFGEKICSIDCPCSVTDFSWIYNFLFATVVRYQLTIEPFAGQSN